MIEVMDKKEIQLLRALVERLSKNEVDEIVRLGQNGALSKDEIEGAINDYPGAIAPPPAEAYDNIVEYDIYDMCSGARKVEFDLWYDGEESDLTLLVDISRSCNGGYVIRIDDIHVL